METKAPPSREECVQLLMRSLSVKEQLDLRQYLQGDDYYSYVARVYLGNPFFRLTNDELDSVLNDPGLGALRGLVVAREVASRSTSPKYSVYCMPKSGSSFVQSALQHALQLPVLSMTSFGQPHISSFFGMNAREQELDELALVKAILSSPRGFVSQNHTRYSMYLGLQLRFFRITPIVTVRNVLDCIVSFDEMMLKWRAGKGDQGWVSDAQFALPLNYPELAPDLRYDLLARSFGVWLISFYLSWKRGAAQNVVSPLFIRYEDDVLDKEQFVDLVTSRIEMTGEEKDRLAQYVSEPDPERSRLNVGVRGRGRDKVPEAVSRWLADYANAFRDEIPEDEIRALIR